MVASRIVLIICAVSADGDCGSSEIGTSLTERLRYETVYTGPDTACDINKLEPASQYAIRVRAHSSMGGSPWGVATIATTAATAPTPPCSLSVNSYSPAEMQLCWLPPANDNGAPVTSYAVEMAPMRTGSSKAGGIASSAWNKAWSGSMCACQVGGLLPGRGYQFRVRACNTQGWSPWGEVATASTLPAEPGAPPKPTFSQRTATSVKAKWGLPTEENGSAVASFTLQMRHDDSNDSDFTEVYQGVELSSRVTQLQPGSTFSFRVAAVNAVGQGPWSDVETVCTALRPPPPPATITTHVIDGSDSSSALKLIVAWSPAQVGPKQAEAVGYEVEVLPLNGGGTGNAVKQTVAKATTATLQGLQPGCSYQVKLRSVGAEGAGHSHWSDGVTVVLPAAKVMVPVTADHSTESPAGTPGTLAVSDAKEAGKHCLCVYVGVLGGSTQGAHRM